MGDNYPNRKPGDYILNRYMPNASEEEREQARENLRALARAILRVATRLATEEYEAAIRAKAGHALDLKGGSEPSS